MAFRPALFPLSVLGPFLLVFNQLLFNRLLDRTLAFDIDTRARLGSTSAFLKAAPSLRRLEAGHRPPAVPVLWRDLNLTPVGKWTLSLMFGKVEKVPFGSDR